MPGNRATTSLHALAAIALATLAAGAACAPPVTTPAEAARTRDRDDSEALAAQLGHLPTVRSAHVLVRRPVVDPLRAQPAEPASASVLLVLEPGAVPGPALEHARALAAAALPELTAARLAIVAEPAAPPVKLATVGPFRVAASSRVGLLATLVLLLLGWAALGGLLVLRERRRR